MSRQQFSQLMDDLGAIYNRDVSPSLKRMYWDDLIGHSMEQIERAAQCHRRDLKRGRFFPTPADLLAQMPGRQEMTSDEAWAICLKSLDETETVIINSAILEARAVALPILDGRDRIGARMAFASAYDRAMTARRHAGTPLDWRVSLGWDVEKRAPALDQAVSAGLLTGEQAQSYLPAPKPVGVGAAIAGLLKGNVVEFPGGADAKTRERLAELREAIRGRREESVELMAEERDRFEQRKRKEIGRLEEFGVRCGGND